jgi:hypothetical protein
MTIRLHISKYQTVWSEYLEASRQAAFQCPHGPAQNSARRGEAMASSSGHHSGAVHSPVLEQALSQSAKASGIDASVVSGRAEANST